MTVIWTKETTSVDSPTTLMLPVSRVRTVRQTTFARDFVLQNNVKFTKLFQDIHFVRQLSDSL